MKNTVILIILFSLTVVVSAQSGVNNGTRKKWNDVTRYYKQVKIVTKNGKERISKGGGQFITFNNKGCYDSDRSGYKVNNGFLNLEKETSDRVYYSGSSYWGEAVYIFTENYKRLNIRINNGNTTYVYVLATPLANVNTCTLIKEAKNNTGNSSNRITTDPIIINPVNPTPDIPKNTFETGPKSKQKYVTSEENCHICFGSGKCSKCNGTGIWYPIYTQEASVCSCNYGKCGTCAGKGKVLKGKWITVYE